MTWTSRTDLPTCSTKKDLNLKWHLTPGALVGRIKRALKSKKLLLLKKGLYIATITYLNEPNKTKLTEYIASQLYAPSYISLEYILESHQLLPLRPMRSITSITSKTTRAFTNPVGSFAYANIKPSMYFGYEEATFHDKTYHIATKAKALFDYLYLNSTLNIRNEKQLYHQLLSESNIQWHNFSEENFKEFETYVWKSNSRKMMTIREAIGKYFEGKKFDRWAKSILA